MYIGYLAVNKEPPMTTENLIPHGIGLLIDPFTLKVHLSGQFERGWLEGLGR